MKYILLVTFLSGFITACSPETGSDEWCKSLKEKHKADWTSRELKDFTKHCIFK